MLIATPDGTGEQEIEAEDFAAGIARATHAAEQVNRTLSEDDHVTQFELLTAAALWVMAEQGVEVAVIEAGLGGRYDATSVIDAKVTVLTNVGLEHTRWLGPTLRHIAEEKLAVVRPGGALVLGEGLAEPALEVAERIAGERGAEIVRPAPLAADLRLRSPGAFQRRNFALARASAAAYLDRIGRSLQERAVLAAAAETHIPGRLQRVGEHPPTVLDGAHNPAAVQALLETLPETFGGSPIALVLGVLEDKDAAEMLRMLLPACEHAWFTAPPSERALPPSALQSLARQLDFERVTCQARPDRALAEAQAWALEHDAVVLVCGSVYLVGALLGHLQDSRPSGLEASDSPRPEARAGSSKEPRSHHGSPAR